MGAAAAVAAQRAGLMTPSGWRWNDMRSADGRQRALQLLVRAAPRHGSQPPDRENSVRDALPCSQQRTRAHWHAPTGQAPP